MLWYFVFYFISWCSSVLLLSVLFIPTTLSLHSLGQGNCYEREHQIYFNSYFFFDMKFVVSKLNDVAAGDEDFDSQIVGEHLIPKKRRVRQVVLIF